MNGQKTPLLPPRKPVKASQKELKPKPTKSSIFSKKTAKSKKPALKNKPLNKTPDHSISIVQNDNRETIQNVGGLHSFTIPYKDHSMKVYVSESTSGYKIQVIFS